MNIILPKSLAEPLTIPWFVSDPRNVELARRIQDSLTACFTILDDKYNPIDEPCVIDERLHTSVRSLLASLKQIAEQQGALKVAASSDKTTYRGRHIGNTYIILFRVPRDTKEHIWSGVSWFDKKWKNG